jgi:hypothetical protein
VYIPGDCIVQMPLHTLFRGNVFHRDFRYNVAKFYIVDERCFAQPTKFIPERWTTQPELVKDRSAYIPFGSGKLLEYSL